MFKEPLPWAFDKGELASRTNMSQIDGPWLFHLVFGVVVVPHQQQSPILPKGRTMTSARQRTSRD